MKRKQPVNLVSLDDVLLVVEAVRLHAEYAKEEGAPVDTDDALEHLKERFWSAKRGVALQDVVKQINHDAGITLVRVPTDIRPRHSAA